MKNLKKFIPLLKTSPQRLAADLSAVAGHHRSGLTTAAACCDLQAGTHHAGSSAGLLA